MSIDFSNLSLDALIHVVVCSISIVGLVFHNSWCKTEGTLLATGRPKNRAIQDQITIFWLKINGVKITSWRNLSYIGVYISSMTFRGWMIPFWMKLPLLESCSVLEIYLLPGMNAMAVITLQTRVYPCVWYSLDIHLLIMKLLRSYQQVFPGGKFPPSYR